MMAETSEVKWASDGPGFWGTVRQLTQCAKCGENLSGGQNTPRRSANIFKPTFHFICDGCFNTLPE